MESVTNFTAHRHEHMGTALVVTASGRQHFFMLVAMVTQLELGGNMVKKPV